MGVRDYLTYSLSLHTLFAFRCIENYTTLVRDYINRYLYCNYLQMLVAAHRSAKDTIIALCFQVVQYIDGIFTLFVIPLLSLNLVTKALNTDCRVFCVKVDGFFFYFQGGDYLGFRDGLKEWAHTHLL